MRRGRRAEAEAEFRETVRLLPDYAEARYNFAVALSQNGKPADAEAQFRAAIRLKPDLAEAHINLGILLQRRGQYADALAAYRRGHELGSGRPGWRFPSAQWVRNCERSVELDTRLPAVLAGEARPAGAAEWAEFGRLCQLAGKKQYAAAVGAATRRRSRPTRSWPTTCGPPTATTRPAPPPWPGSGRGKTRGNSAKPSAPAGVVRRVTWLRADLTAYAALLEGGAAADRTRCQTDLHRWQRDADLAGLREPAASQLPAEELDGCRQLWADVAALLAKAGG